MVHAAAKSSRPQLEFAAVASSSREYLVYADGSCLGNPGPGGWGVVVRDPDGEVTELNGHDDSTTNNRMELMAAIEGLRATERGAARRSCAATASTSSSR